jgi:SAM-dependent methyltransferase
VLHQNHNCVRLDSCVACGSNNLKLTLDLGQQPLANSYKLNRDDQQAEYPLAINRCTDCYHVQLTHSVRPELMFEDYLYVSGTSRTMHDHMERFASFTDQFVRSKVVLDVGCNDGTQLDYYKKLGYRTLGVDPAKNLYAESSKRHDIYCDYFDRDLISTLSGSNIGLIVAQNVFAHGPDPLRFLLNARSLMDDDTVLVIQTSQANMILNNEFDTIYHEHISFFNIQSMDRLCKRAGLHLSGVEYMPLHGTSFVFIIHKIDDGSGVDDLIDTERHNGLYDEETYIRYERNAMKIVSDLVSECEAVREGSGNCNLVGYGAAAKGMTLLNFAKLNLDFIVDDNPLKQGRYTPGMSIPIVSADKLNDLTGKTLFVPLAWNFFDEIRTRIKQKHDDENDLFITYFPNVEVRF